MKINIEIEPENMAMMLELVKSIKNPRPEPDNFVQTASNISMGRMIDDMSQKYQFLVDKINLIDHGRLLDIMGRMEEFLEPVKETPE